MESDVIFDDLINELNFYEKQRCIEWHIFNHRFPDWDCDEDICEMDHINYKWELVKEYIQPQMPAQGRNMCQPICRKHIKSYYFSDSCEVVRFLKMVIGIVKE